MQNLSQNAQDEDFYVKTIMSLQNDKDTCKYCTHIQYFQEYIN